MRIISFFLATLFFAPLAVFADADGIPYNPIPQPESWYIMKSDQTLNLVDKGPGVFVNLNTGSNNSLQLPAGTEVKIITLDVPNNLLEIGITQDLSASNAGVDKGGPVQAAVDLDAFLATNPELTNGGADFGEDLIRGAQKQTPHCLRDVWMATEALVGVGKIPQAGEFRYEAAAESYGPYHSRGWKPAQFSASLPYGAICISSGGEYNCGPIKCGHIAFFKKGAAHPWYGAGQFDTPWLSGHTPIGCLTPPGK